MKIIKWVLPCVILFSLWLRLFGLMAESIWFDEGETLRNINATLRPRLAPHMLIGMSSNHQKLWLTLFQEGYVQKNECLSWKGYRVHYPKDITLPEEFREAQEPLCTLFLKQKHLALFHYFRNYSYIILLRVLSFFFGSSLRLFRLFSVACGVGSVYMTYRIARGIYNDQALGTGAALLLACSPMHIFYSQDATCYSWLCFLALAWIWFFLKTLDDHKLFPRFWVGFSIISGFLLTAHALALFIPVSALIYLLSLRRTSITMKMMCIFLGILSLIAFAGNSLWVLLFNSKDFPFPWNWIPHISPGQALANIITTFSAGGPRLGGYDFYLPVATHFPYRLASLICFLLFAAGALLRNESPAARRSYQSKCICFLTVLPVAMLIIVSHVCFPAFIERYLIYSLPGFLILIAAGMRQLCYRRGSYCFTLGIFFLMLVQIPLLQCYYGTPQKTDWRSARIYLTQSLNVNAARDVIILDPTLELQLLIMPAPLKAIGLSRIQKQMETPERPPILLPYQKRDPHFLSKIPFDPENRLIFIQTRWAGEACTRPETPLGLIRWKGNPIFDMKTNDAPSTKKEALLDFIHKYCVVRKQKKFYGITIITAQWSQSTITENRQTPFDL